jgi:hypothetical protein
LADIRRKFGDCSQLDRHFHRLLDYHRSQRPAAVSHRTASYLAAGDHKKGFEMHTLSRTVGFIAIAVIAGSANAETMRSRVAFNTAIQQLAPEQPPDGVAMNYPVTLSGGELDGCTAQISESLFPRDDGSWGVFEVEADVTCDRGAFRFASSGSWDGNGFHGAGRVYQGNGAGNFANLGGRVAQIGGKLVPATKDGTFDVSYELLIDRTDN